MNLNTQFNHPIQGDYKMKTKDQRPKIQDPKSTICGLTFAE